MAMILHYLLKTCSSLCLSTRQERQAGLHDILYFCIKNKVSLDVVSAKYLSIKLFFSAISTSSTIQPSGLLLCTVLQLERIKNLLVASVKWNRASC